MLGKGPCIDRRDQRKIFLNLWGVCKGEMASTFMAQLGSVPCVYHHPIKLRADLFVTKFRVTEGEERSNSAACWPQKIRGLLGFLLKW